jgi:hypothetical protein
MYNNAAKECMTQNGIFIATTKEDGHAIKIATTLA